jgi:hypothetical protein
MLFGAREHAPDRCDQTLEFDRFGIELVAPRRNGLLALALQGMRGHADDRDTLLVRSGFSERRSFLLVFLAAGLTTPLGTLASYPCVSQIGPSPLGLLLALSAGALIYVGATHLLPRAEREPRRFSLVALAAGVLVALGIIMSKG